MSSRYKDRVSHQSIINRLERTLGVASGAHLLPSTPCGDLEARPLKFSSKSSGGGRRRRRCWQGTDRPLPLVAAAPVRRSSAGRGTGLPGRGGGGGSRAGRGCGRSARSLGGTWRQQQQQQPGTDAALRPARQSRALRDRLFSASGQRRQQKAACSKLLNLIRKAFGVGRAPEHFQNSGGGRGILGGGLEFCHRVWKGSSLGFGLVWWFGSVDPHFQRGFAIMAISPATENNGLLFKENILNRSIS